MDRLDWTSIATQLDSEGYALLPGLLDAGRARNVARRITTAGGDFSSPLETWHAELHRRLPVIANRWNEILGRDERYSVDRMREQCHPSRLGEGDHIPLHQHEGERVFPLQIVTLLSEPGHDFQGGEFVMTERRPRMQSRPMVLPLKLGDAAIIATAERPFKGSGGYYRVNLKHAISRVLGGERIGLELSFHDAL
ncbi:2OG-Fe(II) oxygenase [Solilutibacter silvestris]|uniref:2OG-Fe(II) oxygenase n=1 Tax=Solilutibacter silvestris TaxID=1645665 RepID=UPI003D333649